MSTIILRAVSKDYGGRRVSYTVGSCSIYTVGGCSIYTGEFTSRMREVAPRSSPKNRDAEADAFFL